MAKFSRGDLVRVVEYRDPAFAGFEGAVTRVYEPGGGGTGGSPEGGEGAADGTGVAHYDVQIEMLNAPLSGIPEDDLELA